MVRAARQWWPGWVAIALDVLIVFSAHLGALLLRFDGAVPQDYWGSFMAFIPLIAGVYVVANLIARGYGVDALRRVPMAALISAALVIALWAYWPGAFRPMPLSVVVFGAGLSLVGFIGVRLAAEASRRRPSRHPAGSA